MDNFANTDWDALATSLCVGCKICYKVILHDRYRSLPSTYNQSNKASLLTFWRLLLQEMHQLMELFMSASHGQVNKCLSVTWLGFKALI